MKTWRLLRPLPSGFSPEIQRLEIRRLSRMAPVLNRDVYKVKEETEFVSSVITSNNRGAERVRRGTCLVEVLTARSLGFGDPGRLGREGTFSESLEG